MINIVENKGISGVSTTTSSKKVPWNDYNSDQQPKSNMAANTGYFFYMLRYHLGASVPWPDLLKKCDLCVCEKKKHWHYKPYS